MREFYCQLKCSHADQQQTITCSSSTIEAQEKGVKYVQS